MPLEYRRLLVEHVQNYVDHVQNMSRTCPELVACRTCPGCGARTPLSRSCRRPPLGCTTSVVCLPRKLDSILARQTAELVGTSLTVCPA
eukprot:7061062-Pyramimonas_sp.AAC.1